jgi:CotH protein
MRRVSLLAILVWTTAGVVAAGQVRIELLGVGRGPQPASADAFFDDTLVHEIWLNLNSRDWQSLKDHYLEDTYYPTDFRWRDQVLRNAGIRSRGAGSRSGIKPGLRVDFDRYTTDQKFLGLKSFVLRNNTQDASNMHERLSMLLFRRMGLLASREAHTKLFINNQYAGLYTIVESIDKAFLKRTLNEEDGYLFEYDNGNNATPYYFEDRGTMPDTYVPVPFKPETHEDDPRPEFIVDLVQTINDASAAFRTTIADYLDLAKFIRYVAVEKFLADEDGFLSEYGGMANFYFYRFENKKLFTFIAWDKSEAFKGGISYRILHNITDVPSAHSNRLLEHALSSRDLYDLYLDSLMECVRSASEAQAGSADGRGWLEREVEREYTQIRDAALSDPEKTYTNEDFERTVSELKVFARQRGDFVTSEVNAAREQSFPPR